MIFILFTCVFPVSEKADPQRGSNQPKKRENTATNKTNPGWWFGTFVIFPYIGNNNPN